jgi:hypothetical protein
VGLGEFLWGERGERAKSVSFPKPFHPTCFLFFLFSLRTLLKGFESFKPTVVQRKHIQRDTWFSGIKDVSEILHCQSPWLSCPIQGFARLKELADKRKLR